MKHVCSKNSRAARLLGLFSLVFCIAHVRSATALPPTFEGLGFLPGGDNSIARAVSADGAVVVGASTGGRAALRGAFRWQAGAMTDLGTLPGHDNAFAWAVSADGATVVGSSGDMLDGQFRAFRWTASTDMVELGDLPGGDEYSDGFATSADGGRVVGWSTSAKSLLEAFYWSGDEGMIGLGFAVPGPYSSANGISDDGMVVTGASYDDLLLAHAFKWTAKDGFTVLGLLSENSTENAGQAVSGDGTTIVGTDAGQNGMQAFRWRAGHGMIGLGVPPGYASTRARDVSFDGDVVVGVATVGPVFSAFVWDQPNGMRLLRDVLADAGLSAALAGWTLRECTGVSADGRVFVGNGTDPQGRAQAWRASLGCPTDVDDDGDMDQQDLGIVLAFYGCTYDASAEGCRGDIDGDGDTDQADLGALLAVYGTTCFE